MSGRNCVPPPPLPPPELVTPEEYWTPSPEEIPVTAISSVLKDAGDPIRADCATAFADAWSAWQADEQVGTPPYETAALVCMTMDVGANVLCAIASQEPTYTVDFSDYIPASATYALDRIVAVFDWDYGHDNSPWKLILEFGDVEYEIEAGIAEVTVAVPDSLDYPGELKITQNNTMPPAPCPTPVTRYTMIHEITMLKAYWKPRLLSTYNLDTDPPDDLDTLTLAPMPKTRSKVAPPAPIPRV